MKDDDDGKRENESRPSNLRYTEEAEQDVKLWGVFLFGLIGATVTTFAVSFSFLFSSIQFIYWQ